MKHFVVAAAFAALVWILAGCDPAPKITGTVTWKGGALNGLQAWVLVGRAGSTDTPFVEPVEADGSFEVVVSEGEWEVYAVVDVDGSGSPGGAWFDAMGHAPDMPFPISDQDLDGVEVNVQSAYGWTASCFDGGAPTMVGLGARVLTASSDDLGGEAVVTIAGGDEPIDLDPDALAREWVPYCSGGIPMDGPTDYTFTVSHPDHYDPSVSFTLGSGGSVRSEAPISHRWNSPPT
jgi:hypothetical protein